MEPIIASSASLWQTSDCKSTAEEAEEEESAAAGLDGASCESPGGGNISQATAKRTQFLGDQIFKNLISL